MWLTHNRFQTKYAHLNIFTAIWIQNKNRNKKIKRPWWWTATCILAALAFVSYMGSCRICMLVNILKTFQICCHCYSNILYMYIAVDVVVFLFCFFFAFYFCSVNLFFETFYGTDMFHLYLFLKYDNELRTTRYNAFDWVFFTARKQTNTHAFLYWNVHTREYIDIDIDIYVCTHLYEYF